MNLTPRLDTLAVVAAQVLDDLAVLRAVLVDRDADAATRRGQRAAVEAGELALDVEEADLAEIEQVAVEAEPLVHIALVDVVGQVVEVVEADPLRVCAVDPVELGVVGVGLVILVGEVEQRPADALDGGPVERLVRPLVRLGPLRHRVTEGVLGIDHPPGHRGRAGTVLGDEPLGEAAGFGVQDIGDVALLPELDRLRLVGRGVHEAHAPEEVAQGLRVGAGKLDELEPVGAGGVLGADRGLGGVVGEGTHLASSCMGM